MRSSLRLGRSTALAAAALAALSLTVCGGSSTQDSGTPASAGRPPTLAPADVPAAPSAGCTATPVVPPGQAEGPLHVGDRHRLLPPQRAPRPCRSHPGAAGDGPARLGRRRRAPGEDLELRDVGQCQGLRDHHPPSPQRRGGLRRQAGLDRPHVPGRRPRRRREHAVHRPEPGLRGRLLPRGDHDLVGGVSVRRPGSRRRPSGRHHHPGRLRPGPPGAGHRLPRHRRSVRGLHRPGRRESLGLQAPDGSGRTLAEVGVKATDRMGPPVPDVAAAWAARNGCDATPPTETPVPPDVTKLSWTLPRRRRGGAVPGQRWRSLVAEQRVHQVHRLDRGPHHLHHRRHRPGLAVLPGPPQGGLMPRLRQVPRAEAAPPSSPACTRCSSTTVTR